MAFRRHRKNTRLGSARPQFHSRRSLHFHCCRRYQKRNLISPTPGTLPWPQLVLPLARRGKRQRRCNVLLGLLPRRTGTSEWTNKTNGEFTNGRRAIEHLDLGTPHLVSDFRFVGECIRWSYYRRCGWRHRRDNFNCNCHSRSLEKEEGL